MKQQFTVLVVDDEDAILRVMKANLSREGFLVKTASDGNQALQILQSDAVDTVILDYLMPGMNGLELMHRMREQGLEIPIIIVTAYGTIEQAVQAMKMGAFNYLTKPINYDELISIVNKAVEQRALTMEVQRLRQEITSQYGFDQIVGQNEKMRQIFQLIQDVAETDATVLIRGETGTGKELIARALHFNSARKNQPFVRVNCPAITETLLESELFGHEKGAFTGAIKKRIGRFEQADGGTIFLDEVGDLPLGLQSKLLRVLQEKEFERVGGNQTIKVDVRIISATNKDLEAEVRAGNFRQDLFYRLNVVPIYIPPLRERLDDIPLLATHFLEKYRDQFNKPITEITSEGMALLMDYNWPGNVRQLENVIERAIILEKDTVLHRETLARCLEKQMENVYAFPINARKPLRVLKEQLVENFEREYIVTLLKEFKGNISAAARAADIHYKNFYEKMKKYGIKRSDYQEE